MAEIIALLYPEICYRGVCYKSVPLYTYVRTYLWSLIYMDPVDLSMTEMLVL